MSARRIGIFSWGAAGLLTLGWALLWMGGIRLNTSASIPLGLWRERPLNRAIQRGDVVSICPADTVVFYLAKSRGYLKNGWCAGSFEVMFKPVVAIAGDAVTVTPFGITVNGRRIRRSAALPADSQHRPLPAQSSGVYIVGKTQVWLISDSNEHSFDSRYFGPMSTTAVRGLLTPMAIHGSRGAEPPDRSDITAMEREP